MSEEEEEKEEIKVKLEIIKKPALTYLQREEIYENTVKKKKKLLHKLKKGNFKLNN